MVVVFVDIGAVLMVSGTATGGEDVAVASAATVEVAAAGTCPEGGPRETPIAVPGVPEMSTEGTDG